MVSWQGQAPSGAVIEVALQAAADAAAPRWTRWWTLGVWSEDQAARRSVNDQADDDGAVYTDTLVLQRQATALAWRATLRRGPDGQAPQLRGVVVALPAPDDADPAPAPAVAPLAVPPLRQLAFPDGGAVWCSPTSLTMVLAYWAAHTGRPALAPFTDPQAVPAVTVPAVYDSVYEGAGNWVFNTAFAASLGLDAHVARLSGLAELSAWLGRGVPVIASIRWKAGELDGAAVQHTAGHLVVVVGIDAAGNVIVNDPAAHPERDEPVQRTYRADQFRRAWAGSGQTVYLVYPDEVLSDE